MKKILISIFSLNFFIMTFSQNVIFSEDFSDSLSVMNSWTIYDEDPFESNDVTAFIGDKWEWSFVQGMISNSKFNESNTLGPTDDWLITPQINIPNNNNKYRLTFKVNSFIEDLKESYEVKLSTSGFTVADFTSTILTVDEETSNPENTRSILLPDSISNNSIYLCFRHTSNKKDMLLIQDVKIEELTGNDLILLADSTKLIAQNNDLIIIKGVVKNNGVDTINSFNLTYNAGNGDVSTIINAVIPPIHTYNYSHSTPLSVNIEDGPYDVYVKAKLPEEFDTTNNSKSYKIHVVSSIEPKKVFFEERTGTWCTFCPLGMAIADSISDNMDNVVTVAIHNNDPMAVSFYDNALNDFYIGYPSGIIDRVYKNHIKYYSKYIHFRTDIIPLAKVDVKSYIENDKIKVKAKVKAVSNMKGDYRLGFVLIEDEVKGSGNSWLQVNEYSGGDISVLHTTDGQTFDWKDLGNPVNVSDVFGGYDHVARAFAGNDINGVQNSLPNQIKNDSIYSYTHTFNINSNWNTSKMKAIAFFVDANTNEVINVSQTKVGIANVNQIENSNFKLSIYPNPSNGFINLLVKSNKQNKVNIKIIGITGKVLLNLNDKETKIGELTYSLNLSNLPQGIYFAEVQVGDQIQTKKILIK